MMQGLQRMEKWAWDALSITINVDTQEFDRSELADLYHQWNTEAENWLRSRHIGFLRFKVTDGWHPLCEFLSKTLGDKEVDKICDEMIASGEPSPRANMDL